MKTLDKSKTETNDDWTGEDVATSYINKTSANLCTAHGFAGEAQKQRWQTASSQWTGHPESR